MGNLINQATSLAGVRLFPNGPYPDAGMGDKALASSAKTGAAGANLLTQGQQALPSIFDQLSSATGVTNPWGSGTPKAGPGGAQTQTLQGGASRAEDNPFQLAPIHVMEFNNRAGRINAKRAQALKTATAHLSSMGLGKSSARALEQLINKQADDELNDTYNTIAQNAYGTKLQTLGNFLNQANQQIGQGAGLIGQDTNTLQNAAHAAEARTNAANNAFGSFLGAAAGGFTGLPGVGKPGSSSEPIFGGSATEPGSAAWYIAHPGAVTQGPPPSTGWFDPQAMYPGGNVERTPWFDLTSGAY